MWWAQLLDQRRHEVRRARRRLENGPGAVGHGRPALSGPGLSLFDGAAIAFAAVSILGPVRAVRLAIGAVSAYKAMRALWSSTGRLDGLRRLTK